MSQMGEPDQITSKSLYPVLGVYDSNVCFTFYSILVTFPQFTKKKVLSV